MNLDVLLISALIWLSVCGSNPQSILPHAGIAVVRANDIESTQLQEPSERSTAREVLVLPDTLNIRMTGEQTTIDPTFVAVVISGIISLGGILVTLYVARQQQRLTQEGFFVSARRDWSKDVRQRIAEFLSVLMSFLATEEVPGEAEVAGKIETVSRLEADIALLLDTTKTTHAELLQNIVEFRRSVHGVLAQKKRGRVERDALTKITQQRVALMDLTHKVIGDMRLG